MKEAWSQDRQGACEKAGLDPDTALLEEADYGHTALMAMSLSTKEVSGCTCGNVFTIEVVQSNLVTGYLLVLKWV